MTTAPWITLDATSLVVEVEASATLAAIEAALGAQSPPLTLDVDAIQSRGAVGPWLAAGAPGARDPFRDPADHLLAGLEATLTNGRALTIRPGPRRAVGPDLVALFVGCAGRFGAVTRAWLRVHRVGVARPDAAPFDYPRDAAMTEGEARLLDAIARELTTPSR